MNVAFIGTGLLGYPMAERLAKQGFSLIAYNRTREKALPLQNVGTTIASSPAEAIAAGDVAVLVLTDFPAIKAVLDMDGTGVDVAGKTIVQVSTILPDESLTVHRWVEERGGRYLEAPVLGSRPEATEGRLQVLVGGERALMKSLQGLLSTWGPVYYLGGVGKAAAVKLALNQLIAALLSAFSVSLAMVRRADADVDTFMEILRNSKLYAPTFDKKLPRLLERNFDNPNFPTRHLLKDVSLIEAQARKLGVNTRTIEAVRHIIEETLEKGWVDTDYSSIYNAIDPPEK